jgi:hypothetical protein
MNKTYKPGETASRSGEYEIRGPRGGHTGEERTVVKGAPFPPTRQSGESYSLTRPAHNNAGRPSKR